MNGILQKKFGILITIASLFVCIPSLFFLLQRSIDSQWDKVWEGYYPILLPIDGEGKKMEQAVAEHFPVLGLENTVVEYFDFNGLKKIPLADVETRFTSFDSRVDPYMAGLKKYFSTKDGKFSIIYCRSDLSALRMYMHLRRILSEYPNTWTAVDIDWTIRAVLGGMFVLVMAVTIFSIPRRRLMVPLLGIPWLPLVLFGPIHAVMIASIFFYASVLTAEYIRLVVREYLNTNSCASTKTLLITGGLSWVPVLLFTGFILRTSRFDFFDVFNVLFAGIASISTITFIIGTIILKKHRQEHTLFFHIPLAGRRRLSLRFPRLLPVPVLLAVIIGTPIFVQRITPSVDTFIPGPGEISVRTADYESLSSLGSLSDPEEPSLPGITDYLKHRAYQKGWLYKVPYELPVLGGSYSISTFYPADKGIVKENKTVITYDENWYHRELEEGSGTGVLDLLLRQPRFTRVIYKKLTQTTFMRLEIIVYWIAWFAIQVCGLFSYTHLTPVTLYGMKALDLRRQFQAA